MLPIRTNKVQLIADPDRLIMTSTLRKDLLKGWAEKMVNKIKESSAVQIWAAPVLLALVLGYTVYNGQQTSADIKELNKQLIILQTQKEELEKQTDRERQEKFQLTREQEIWRENIKNQINELKYAMRIPDKKEGRGE